MQTSDCCAPCASVQSVSIPGPEGPPSAAGQNGIDGVDSFTFAVTPDAAAVIQGGTTTVNVLNSTAFAVGQNVWALGALFTVVSKPTPTTMVLQLLVTGVNPATVTIVAGTQISPGGTTATALPSVNNYNLAGAQALTNAFATILTASITLANAGTYLLFAGCRFDLAAATFAANEEVTVKLARTNNTPADVANATAGIATGTPTTQTGTLGEIAIPIVQYTAAAGDVIEMQAMVSTVPGAGTVDAISTSMLAIQLF